MGPFFREGGPQRDLNQSNESVPQIIMPKINMQSAETLLAELSQRLAEGRVISSADSDELLEKIKTLQSQENFLDDKGSRYEVAGMRAKLSALKKQIDDRRYSLKKVA